MCDPDGFGQVTFDGFHKLFSRGEEHSVSKPSPPPQIQPTAPFTSPAIADEETPLNERATIFDVMFKFAELEDLKPSYVKRVYKKFQSIDKQKTGHITYSELLEVLEVDDSPLMTKMFDCLDFDKTGNVELKDLVVTLSNHTNASRSDKLKFTFLLFDENGRGWISKKELFKLLKANFGEMSTGEIDSRIAELLQLIGKSGDSQPLIKYEEFMLVAKTNASLIFPVKQLSSGKSGITNSGSTLAISDNN